VISNNLNKQAAFCLVAIVGVLSACGSLTRSDKPTATTWWLEPYTTSMQVVASEQPLLVTVTVTVVPGLDSDQVLTLSDKAVLKPYAGARWADHLPELVASLVGRSLEASGRFEILSGRAGPGSENCDLQLELSEFFADLSPTGQTSGVSVVVNGRFVCESAEMLVVQSNVSIPVADEHMAIIVAAFQQALDSVTQDILNIIK